MYPFRVFDIAFDAEGCPGLWHRPRKRATRGRLRHCPRRDNDTLFAGTSSFVLAIIARETVHYFRRHGISKQSIVRFVLSCCALVAFLLVLFYVFSSEVGYAAASMVIGGGVYAFLRMHGISKRIAISVAIYCSLFLLFLFVL